MLPDPGKIIAADQTGQEMVAQAQQEVLALKRQTNDRVRESQAQLQEDLARVRQAGVGNAGTASRERQANSKGQKRSHALRARFKRKPERSA